MAHDTFSAGAVPGRPVLLVIMDGWGWREEAEGNAIRLAATPNLDRYGRDYPFTLLEASGEAVGLPAGQMGNSEVGHLNLGAGRIVYQELTRIDKAIADGSFFRNEVLLEAVHRAREAGGTLHLLGLVSDGGVHSQMEHLFALLRLARDAGLPRVVVHAFLDGRDTLPTSGAGHVRRLLDEMAAVGCGRIGTLVGRYYAMDRDRRWDRVQRAYAALVRGEGRRATDPVAALEAAYQAGETDEFVRPVVLAEPDGMPLPRVADGDAVIFFNFRADRARQLTRAFTEPGFSEFDVADRPRLATFVTLTRYDEHFDLPAAFPPQHLDRILGQVVSEAGIPQLRVAETEKYAHVTYFFNGGEEQPFPGEDRVLVPSPREVATYDLKPEMSARGVAEAVLERTAGGRYGLVVVNFANGDMVGHTGVFEAAVRACEVVDECVGRITEAWRAGGGAALITADHGNAEVMLAPGGGAATAHTMSPVPFYLVDDIRRDRRLRRGILADVAPTALAVMGLAQPADMTGRPLFEG
ncbi:2,3-bisphosphoglycerate-independent phosphoglycerate mutase [Dissulfurirhabdus thermomarina]|uniref:2,3-bisphosphoglycerate-independent phosphoglycerate mutase n=1 Tax=Dissulfurirhabdus thermomarina TaxID=1765737 RepID=A0A6N9TS50_DISTH|nr:2,3-bisphosphoglycerate-independent phosphoglycerate mutase [Dissulfurirhabdus thermomarina]NDY43250.1 2,3-bisphosphoglycerate-independent phosphoglycerate mutase [Dissulfurirhabdus thermomarina]NMX22592.1 2,3-bisphosphoglycerate-independent phosphoglycerate mutase [Dissulfurirhabdus thermomarina]